MNDDLISRQDAIDAVSDCGICMQRILDLPSVQPEQKHGHWIVTNIPNLTSTAQDVVTFTRQCRCSECGAMFGRESDKYCYNCGARMEGTI